MVITKSQNLKIICTAGSNLAFPDILSRNIFIGEYQNYHLQHKRITRDIEFFDEHGTPVTNQIQHEDNSNETYNDFYPMKYKRGNERKILRLQNDGEHFTVSSMLDELPIISVQQSSDCFRMGQFINQFRQICGPETKSSAPVNASNTDYNSINSPSRPKMTQQTRRAPATTHTTSVHTLKITILYVTSIFKLIKRDFVEPNKLTTLCSGKLVLR